MRNITVRYINVKKIQFARKRGATNATSAQLVFDWSCATPKADSLERWGDIEIVLTSRACAIWRTIRET